MAVVRCHGDPELFFAAALGSSRIYSCKERSAATIDARQCLRVCFSQKAALFGEPNRRLRYIYDSGKFVTQNIWAETAVFGARTFK
jgi:hypothetical protein